MRLTLNFKCTSKGFNAMQNSNLEGLGCKDGNDGHVAGGIDTHTAEQMVAYQCDIELPRTEGGKYISLLDECGGHTKEYHFHERLSCLYDVNAAGHSAKVGESMDGVGIYGKWEDEATSTVPLLDACGGHIGFNPDTVNDKVYHYHVQEKAPFTVGCAGPNDDGSLVTVAECREFYSGCGDGDEQKLITKDGTVVYDLWCPCFDANGNNFGTIVELAVFGTSATGPTTVTTSTPESAVNNTATAKPGSCMCTAEYNPVCGSDAVTYKNKCEASCARVEKYTDSSCKDSEPNKKTTTTQEPKTEPSKPAPTTAVNESQYSTATEVTSTTNAPSVTTEDPSTPVLITAESTLGAPTTAVNESTSATTLETPTTAATTDEPAMQCDLVREWICKDAVSSDEKSLECCTITQCNIRSEFETKAPGIRRDRECTATTTCQHNVEYEARKSTATSDRDCQPVTVCNPTESTVHRAATKTSDRVCTPLGKVPEKTELALSLVFAMPKEFEIASIKDEDKAQLQDEFALAIKSYLILKTNMILDDIVEVRIYFGGLLWGSSTARRRRRRRATDNGDEMVVEVITADNTAESVETLAAATVVLDNELLAPATEDRPVFTTSVGIFSLTAIDVVETVVVVEVDAIDPESLVLGESAPDSSASAADGGVDPSAGGSSSLSTNAAIGIGCGLLVLLLIVSIAVLCIKCKDHNQKVAPAAEQLEDGSSTSHTIRNGKPRRPSAVRTPNQWIAANDGNSSSSLHFDAAERQHARASIASLQLQPGSLLPFDGGESANSNHRRPSYAGVFNHATAAVHPEPPEPFRRGSALPPVRAGNALPQLPQDMEFAQRSVMITASRWSPETIAESHTQRRASTASISLEDNIQAGRRHSSSGILLPPPPPSATTATSALRSGRASFDAPLLPPVSFGSSSSLGLDGSRQLLSVQIGTAVDGGNLMVPQAMTKSQRRSSIAEKQAELKSLLDADAAANDLEEDESDSADGEYVNTGFQTHQHRPSQVMRVASAGHHRHRIASANQRREREGVTRTMLHNRIGNLISSEPARPVNVAGGESVSFQESALSAENVSHV